VKAGLADKVAPDKVEGKVAEAVVVDRVDRVAQVDKVAARAVPAAQAVIEVDRMPAPADLVVLAMDRAMMPGPGGSVQKKSKGQVAACVDDLHCGPRRASSPNSFRFLKCRC
jgi:hypothetical protein